MNFDEHYAFRAALIAALERDLLGPTTQFEVIDDDPLTRYALGILYPQNPPDEAGAETIDPAEDIDTPDDGDESTPADPPVALANVHYPSSLGITFAVNAERTRRVRVTVTAARYELEEEIRDSGALPGTRRRRGSESVRRWRRVPVAAMEEVGVEQPSEDRKDLQPGLRLYWKVRQRSATGGVAVTVALINTNIVRRGERRDGASFFQPRIEVDAPTATAPAFVDRGHGAAVADEDLRLYDLLYRHVRTFAVGHGCSADWDVDVSAECVRVYSTSLPQYELLSMDSNRSISGNVLSAEFLSSQPREAVHRALVEFVASYEHWIQGLQDAIDTLPADLIDVARQNIDGCRTAASRMRSGIATLDTDPNAFEAFRLANSALDMQRRRANWIRSGKGDEGPGGAEGLAWRPFQLAFVLLCIDGLVKGDSEQRAIVDLLWFPTGGGKTEAYLALIAFTIFLRRLRLTDRGGGVTALMRYTLRLLTIQQFERAALLMCACEAVRSTRKDLGSDPISVGLWVGQDATPNDRGQARQVLDKLRTNPRIEKGNPVQLHRCPWCGTPLDHRNYYLTADGRRLVIACGTRDCDYRDGLPVFVVDEDIYDWRPTLIIATVDKFASMPWREEVARIFAADDDASRPPELIIQDELHLISGPLGTLTGLYETVIDVLCARSGTPPKIVASTATIRRARAQVTGLFDRAVQQFPPPGVDARDSYFAVQPSRREKASRLYVGAMSAGGSHTTLMIRAYAALLHAASDASVAPAVRDPYWTLVGYFNSLRVLGGARMQVQDDVDDRLSLLAQGGRKRSIDNRIELTSREPSGEIPSHLRRMAITHPDELALDVILATNMISVGVDIDRLGLMVVMGQPQATSEYIQATSRVGRQFPGVVLTLFNSARSRDRSHYESFVPFHAGLYRQVESTSVTTFSSRARDRGLHAIVVALARLLLPELRPNRGAAKAANAQLGLASIKDMVLRRVARIAPDESAETAAELDEIIRLWVGRATTVPNLVYRDTRRPDRALLVDASLDADVDALPTLWSLREVDRSSHLYVVQ